MAGTLGSAELTGSNAANVGFLLAPVSRAYYSSKLSALQRSRLLATIGGATWTTPMLSRMGYAMGRLCSLCGAAEDSITHRLYKCIATQDLWSELPESWLGEVDDKKLLFTRCLAPCVKVSGHSKGYNFVLIGEGSDNFSTFSFSPDQGPVFLDGSCFYSSSPFACAGFSSARSTSLVAALRRPTLRCRPAFRRVLL